MPLEEKELGKPVGKTAGHMEAGCEDLLVSNMCKI